MVRCSSLVLWRVPAEDPTLQISVVERVLERYASTEMAGKLPLLRQDHDTMPFPPCKRLGESLIEQLAALEPHAVGWIGHDQAR